MRFLKALGIFKVWKDLLFVAVYSYVYVYLYLNLNPNPQTHVYMYMCPHTYTYLDVFVFGCLRRFFEVLGGCWFPVFFCYFCRLLDAFGGFWMSLEVLVFLFLMFFFSDAFGGLGCLRVF